MAKNITFMKNAIGPEYNFEAGKTYRVHDAMAGLFLNAEPGDTPAAVLADTDEKKVLKVPVPDPQDEHKGKPAPKVAPKKPEDDLDEDDETELIDDKPTAKKKGK